MIGKTFDLIDLIDSFGCFVQFWAGFVRLSGSRRAGNEVVRF